MEKLTENMIRWAESCTRTRCGAECRNEARLFSITAYVRAKTARSTGDIAV